MIDAARIHSDIDVGTAELAAFTAAIDLARADKRGIPHEEMRKWLLEIAAGNFGAEPPVAHDL